LSIKHNGTEIPIEVKAEENLKAKSLKVYHEKYKPSLALRLSMSDYRKTDWLVNVPLYGVKWLKELTSLNHLA